jgi:hypothetical protein
MLYDVRAAKMTTVRRLMSSLLFAAGIVLVFTGINAALGFTVPGTVASLAAIAGLLYAGAAWAQGPAPSGPVLIFDHQLRLTTGSPLLGGFPAAQRDEVRAKATATLAGARASVTVDGRHLVMAPIVSDSGAVLYGAIVESSPQARHG